MFDAVLDRALRHKVRKRRVPLAAVDGTGMEIAARQPVLRQAAVEDRDRHAGNDLLPSTRRSSWWSTAAATWSWPRCPAGVPGRTWCSSRPALRQAVGRARIGTLLADADFDAEWVHEHVRSYGIHTMIPPERGRPTDKPPAGRWRRRMKQRFDKTKYGQRWQVETVNSMIKRRLGSALQRGAIGASAARSSCGS